MKLISNSNNNFVKILGEQQATSEYDLRQAQFVVTLMTEEGLLMYNTLSCELILLEEEEINNFLKIPYCYDRWFVVPSDFKEKKCVNEYKTLYKLFHSQNKFVNCYTILTTTDCNARCFYCYQQGRNRTTMSEETALKTAEYIINNYKTRKDETKKHVKLSWFGGEPLYNMKVIDIICNELSNAEVPYESIMITNAYLFDADVIEKAIKQWHLRWLQITLDGTETIYNRSKAFIYKDVNAFEQVMGNIKMLLDSGLKMNVRLNIDTHNASDLMCLAYQLKKKFGNYTGFKCYSHTLFEGASPTGHKRSDERRNAVYEKQQKLTSLLNELQILDKPKLLNDIKLNVCMSDSGKSVVITPTGDLSLCEHYTENEFFSNIYTPEKQDLETINRFKEHCEDIDLCDECPVYPQCIRLKMCEEGRDCFPEKKQEKIDKIKMAMLAKYEHWKTKQEDTDEEEINEC